MKKTWKMLLTVGCILSFLMAMPGITVLASEWQGEVVTSATTTQIKENKTKSLSKSFSDVKDKSHPYYKAIYWAAENGITKGYADGTFGINRSCTRGEMMMFLWRYAGKPAPKTVSKSPFKDVQKKHSFYKAILWGYQKGITKGYPDGTFGLNRNVSRGESMMFLWRIKGKQQPKLASKSPFKDVPKTHVFYKAILWGSQKGVTKGYTTGDKKGMFGINDNCTRGQIVTFLYRALAIPTKPENPSESDKYYWDNSEEVLAVIDAKESTDVPSEDEVLDVLDERGFGDSPVIYEYSLDGEYLDETEVTDGSSVRRPMYLATYLAKSGLVWTIYITNGKVMAYPASYNLDSGLDVEVIFSETEELISYDDETNQFYVTIPKSTVVIVNVVERIDAETLDKLTVEEINSYGK